MATPRARTLTDKQLVMISKALADPRRYEIFRKISRSGQTEACCDLLQGLPISAATLSHHIKELENAGLISIERQGKFARLTICRDIWKAYLKHLSEI